MKFKACEARKTTTDAARESRECLHSMPSSKELNKEIMELTCLTNKWLVATGEIDESGLYID